MPAGRPPKYKTAAQLQKKIDEYFELKPEKPTVSGLAYHLGFESRQTIYDIEKNSKELSYTIKKAVGKIESIHEEGLFGNSAAGHIFWLKNRNWSDKQEHEHSGSLKHEVIEWKPAK